MRSVFLLGLAFVTLLQGAGDDSSQKRARSQMVEEIVRDMRATTGATGSSGLSQAVKGAMSTVPRHEFVPAELSRRAYENRPLPIGYGQTISQPFIVALMTELLAVEPGQRVLEVGTGSGYQAAILAAIGVQVFSIEIVPELAEMATKRLDRLGYEIQTRAGDGYFGWPEEAPFDAVVVTAAASHIPPPLVQQLRPGGVMVIPVGNPFSVQQLTLVEKKNDGTVRTRQVLPVVFVPLTGGR